jgi:hypothetical protein
MWEEMLGEGTIPCPFRCPFLLQRLLRFLLQNLLQVSLAVSLYSETVSDYPQGDSNESRKLPEKQASPERGGTDSGTLTAADPLTPLATALMALSAADRARLAAILIANPATKPDDGSEPLERQERLAGNTEHPKAT